MSIILRVGAVRPLRGQETQYGSGDEASASYTDADVLDIPLPEHTYQRPLPAVFSQPQSNTGYFGLPYQDHNYGMPPPPSPPRPPTPEPPPSPLQVNGMVQMEEEVKTSPLVSVVEEVVEDSITRCICGYLHDDGYMICCDKCSVWQHIDCMGVDRNNIPDNYFCELCQPRELDAMRAKVLQKKKREELAARNVLSDSSATDTDPEEAANALAAMVKKIPVTKRKGLKQKRSVKTKEKNPLKLKIAKTGLPKKLKKAGKKEKENIKAIKPKKVFKPGVRKLKEMKSRPLMIAEPINTDPWNSSTSPWVDAYESIQENVYSKDVIALLCDSMRLFQLGEIATFAPYQLQAQFVCVADVKTNRKGLKVTDKILAGQGIIEYTGKVMLKQEYDQQRALFKAATGLQPFVLFHSQSDFIFCVDATACGNESRFVRRSCTPNAEVNLQYKDKKGHFVILAKRDIASDVEVTIPFDYDYHTSSTCIECACLRNNCVISRYWKKRKKLQKKEFTGKRRQQSTGDHRKSQDHLQKVSSPQSSPRKVASPGKAPDSNLPSASPTKMGSPIRLSVSTLLAASALLEAQSEVSTTTDLKPEANDHLQLPPTYTKPATSPPPKSATPLRRGSRTSDDVKEEKTTTSSYQPIIASQHKEKMIKSKEPKHKAKDSKETHVSPPPVEIKRERRLSSRRQSQEETIEESPVKEEVTFGQDNEKEDNIADESYRKMTREERKLDAIMKAFEKMEKREERRKEAIARGEGSSSSSSSSKKVPEQKGKKKDEQEENESHAQSASQDEPLEDEVKVEVEETQGKAQNVSTEVKDEPPPIPEPNQVAEQPNKESRPIKEEPTSQKSTRKFGKRKRRRSRVQTAPPLTDSTPLSQDENSTNSSNAQIPPYIPPAPTSAPLPSSVCAMETDGEEFKYIKSKKHLFNEWSHKHEDECSKREEMFVECLPSPRVNAMDHLQRRNSHSSGCNRALEISGGFAKKRWLRQAMHEEPVPLTSFNHSLSVSTDNGSASPIYGSTSPNSGINLASPGASSPLDFVTPLKKRRLMRESLSTEGNGSIHSPSSGVLSENIAMDVIPKSNGLKSFMPAHRLSVDDRLLLQKNYHHQNGHREVTNVPTVGLLKQTSENTPSSISVCLNFDTVQSKPEDTEAVPAVLTNGLNHKVSNITTAASSTNHLINGFSTSGDTITSVSLSPSRSTPSQLVSLRTPYERMGIDNSGEVASGNESHTKFFSSEENGINSLATSNSSGAGKEETDTDGSSLSRSVVVNSVYNGVNNLMEGSSEAGYVVTKSIMEADGPATVCVDLNVHEMEPLAGGGKTVVDLDKELFSLGCDKKEGMSEVQDDCQVNSSKEVSINDVPLKEEGHNESSCDISGTGSHNLQSITLQQSLSVPDHKLVVCENSDSSEEPCGNTDAKMNIDKVPPLPSVSEPVTQCLVAISSSCHSESNNQADVTVSHADVTVSHADVTGSRTTVSGSHADVTGSRTTVSGSSADVTSGHADVTSNHADDTSNLVGNINNHECGISNRTDDGITPNTSTSECDSVATSNSTIAMEENIDLTMSAPPNENFSGHCDSGSGSSMTSRELELLEDHDHSCDSAGNNVSSAPISSDSRIENYVMQESLDGCDPVSDPDSCNSGPEPISLSEDANVDSTSSEPVQKIQLSSQCSENANQTSFCDSNSERDSRIAMEQEISVSMYDSSSEEVGVSSSSALQLQTRHSEGSLWEEDSVAEAVTREAIPDNVMSSASSPSRMGHGHRSPGNVVSSNSGNNMASCATVESPADACSSSSIPTTDTNVSVSISSGVVSSNTVSTPPSQHSASSLTSSPSLANQDDSNASNQVSTSSDQDLTPTTSSVTQFTSTSEAVPAVKKKVSLLEYRMRLKKPATTATETKTSPPISQPCTTVTLSSMCERFLSSSPSSSSMASYSSSSGNNIQRKQKMPTLATLPLFKSTEKEKEEKKRVERKKVKHLSLSDRLRLEFGLDDADENEPTKTERHGRSYGGGTSSPPPPPPPLLFSTSPGLDPSTGHNVYRDPQPVDSSTSKDDLIPPPPPPSRTYPYSSSAKTVSRPASSFSGAAASIPKSSYIAPMVNGGLGSSQSLPQQPNISSTSVSSHVRESNTLYPPGSRPVHSPGSRPVHSPASHSGIAAYPSLSQTQGPASISPSSSSSSSSLHKPPTGLAQWSSHQVPSPLYHPLGSNSQPSSTSSLPPLQSNHQYDYFHMSSSQSQAVVSGNTVTDDNPPPPPPPPPPPLPRTHLHPLSSSSSSSSSSSHRHSGSSHRRHDSSDRNKKAASSSSHYSDKRSRY